MTRPNLLSICLLAALLAPLAGCQTPPRQGEAQARDREAPARSHEAPAPVREAQAPAREVPASVHEAPATAREAAAPVRESKARSRQPEASGYFTEADIASIRDFYKQGNQPGLTAGRIMKLRRGETYPFGYTWRPLPSDLEARLSPLPKGFIRVLVGTEIGILDIRTRVVVDLLKDWSA